MMKKELVADHYHFIILPQEKLTKHCKIKFSLIYSFREKMYARIPNKHENLFIFGRGGPSFSHVFLQTIYVISVIYFSAFLTFSCTKFYWNNHDMTGDYFILLFVFLIVVPLVLLLTIPVLIYKIITKFTIITNVR